MGLHADLAWEKKPPGLDYEVETAGQQQ